MQVSPDTTGMTRLRRARCLLLAFGLCVAPALSRSNGSSAFATGTTSAQAPLPKAGVATPADRAIAAAQSRLAKVPGDTAAKKALAAAFLQKVREYADPSYYTKVDQILASLGGARSSDPEVLLLEGTLLLARHEFADALKVGQRAVIELPSNAGAQGILVDAYNELGRYDDALAATQRMVDLRPDLAALSRVSYARELRGDVPGAIEAMQQAVTASSGTGEASAYVQTLLGNLLLTQGDVALAASSYAAALRAFPGLAGARAGQAAVLSARGRPAEAARLMSQVVASQPQLQYVIAEGDYFAAAGMTKQANDAYQLVDAIIQLYRSNGVNVDLDVAVHAADQRPTPALLASTRRAVADRPGVVGHHALAWVLHRLGRSRDASTEMAKVIAVGDRDPVFRFHAAAIAAAGGDRSGATAQLDIVLSGNPRAVGISPPELAALAKSLGRTVPAPAP